MADANFLCGVCASLSWSLLESDEGQLYQNCWNDVEANAKLGCRLCAFFDTEKEGDCPKMYSGSQGPIIIRIRGQYSSVFMHVHGDSGMAAYYLFLKAGVLPLCLPHCARITDAFKMYRASYRKAVYSIKTGNQIAYHRLQLPDSMRG
jgi:hypothetical protein